MNAIQRATGLALLLLGFAAASRGEERFVRYRLLEPATSSAAAISAHSNRDLPEMHLSWGRNPLPEKLSNHGLYIAPGAWSPWQRLPCSPMCGDIGLTLRGAEAISHCKVEVQVASWPEEKYIARSMTIENPRGAEVAFTLPPSILETPDLIETLPETFLRRRKMADSVGVPKERRPKLLRFGAHSVGGDATVADSENYELETTRRLGLNTWCQKWISGQFQAIAASGGTPEWAKQLKFTSEDRAHLAYLMAADEPGWCSGFDPTWAKTGERGFRDYLKQQGVSPESFGVSSLEKVCHIRRDKPVAADAPLAQRRLWHWSCRYTYAACSEYFSEINRAIQEKLPNTPVTVNYSDHGAGMLDGALGGQAIDFFEDGRLNAVSMHWSEDWMSSGLTSWGSGLYQKVAYFANLLRGAARYQGISPASVGFYPICVGWDPKGAATCRDVPMRINLLLGQGCKTFSFFNYGPTTSATCDYWADSAPIARGVADAIRMVGGEEIEPHLWAGMPVAPQVCLIYSVENFYWLEANKTQEDEFERQHFYCMLQQNQIPLDIIAGRDLERFIGNYRAAYATDRILARRAANELKKWVEAGGVLALGPQAATRDEYNEPLEVFAGVERGQTSRAGKGWLLRFKEPEGALWWNRTLELCGETGWASAFDRKHQDIVSRPALELAQIVRPVTVNVPGIVADPLVSADAVAVPLVNLLGLFEKEGSRYLNMKVTLVQGKDVAAAWSSRCGRLKLRREGESVAVVMPIEYADVLIFRRR